MLPGAALKMAATTGGGWVESAANYCAGYDLSTYLRHDGVEVKAGATTPLN